MFIFPVLSCFYNEYLYLLDESTFVEHRRCRSVLDMEVVPNTICFVHKHFLPFRGQEYHFHQQDNCYQVLFSKRQSNWGRMVSVDFRNSGVSFIPKPIVGPGDGHRARIRACAEGQADVLEKLPADGHPHQW